MEIPDKLFETILLAVGETAEEVKNENITANETPEIYKKQCEKLACFSELAKDNKTKQALEAREKAKAGEWFRLKELPKVIRHFYLVDAIEHRDSVVEKSILFALLCFLGGQYSYAQEKILNLMKLGAQLFLQM